ncbi:MAG TPA: alginate lyase family protein, partial [Mycobacteriales bacterium]|nr:alginate lyase family protein [Mycobacteriales bacterium]
ALLLVGLALSEEDTGFAAARQALDDLAENADTDIWADGVHRECSTDYHLIVLRSLLGGIGNARRFGLPVPPALLRAADRACDFALHVQRPDGLTPAVSDGDQGDFRAVLVLGSALLHRPDLRWAASGGTSGGAPARRHADFPVGGYFTQRSGWGDRSRPYGDERWLLLDAGPLGDGGHGHYDQLSVEIAAGGRLLVVDPGRYTYDARCGTQDGAPGWRHWFKGTAGHNTVCVDGLDQTPYRPGKPAKGRPTSTARLLGRRHGPGLDLLRAEVVSPCYDAVHTRTIAFVDDDYWVVHDRLRALTPHSYAARWHLSPAAQGALDLGGDRLSAPGLLLLAPLGELTVEPGWVSASYGRKEAAPVAVLSAAGADADLVTVLLPDRDGEFAGARAAAEITDEGVEVRLHRPGTGLDTIRWTHDGAGFGWGRTC